MTAGEHRDAALGLLTRAQGVAVAARTALLLEAQVHATLALAPAPTEARPRARATKKTEAPK